MGSPLALPAIFPAGGIGKSSVEIAVTRCPGLTPDVHLNSCRGGEKVTDISTGRLRPCTVTRAQDYWCSKFVRSCTSTEIGVSYVPCTGALMDMCIVFLHCMVDFSSYLPDQLVAVLQKLCLAVQNGLEQRVLECQGIYVCGLRYGTHDDVD